MNQEWETRTALERSERVSWVRIRKRISGGREWIVVFVVMVGVWVGEEKEEDERMLFLFSVFL